MKRCKYAVHYGNEVARFSGYGHAMEFARYISAAGGWLAEVTGPTGMVGQYSDGETTPEFVAHHATRGPGYSHLAS